MQSLSKRAGVRRTVADSDSDDSLDVLSPPMIMKRSVRPLQSINAIPPVSSTARATNHDSDQSGSTSQADKGKKRGNFEAYADHKPGPARDPSRTKIKRDRLVRPAPGEALIDPALLSATSRHPPPSGDAILYTMGDGAAEAEAELSDDESEAESDGSGGSDSSMEWEADEEVMGDELSEDGSDTESTSDPTSPSTTSIMHLSLKSLTDRFTSLHRKLARLEKTKAAGRMSKARAKRLSHQLEAERYALSLYRQALRKSQAEVAKGEKELATSRTAHAEAAGRFTSADDLRLVAEKKRKEADKKLVAMAADLKRVEGLRADSEAKALLYARQADLVREDAQRSSRTFAERSAALTAQKFEEIERRQTADAEREEAKKGRGEAESKLAMIRDAHDLERAMYLKHIKELEDRVKVKVEGNGRG